VKPFVARLDVLPAAQRALWDDLGSLPRGWVLYGGTALALRLGHRTSVDFDLFSSEKLDHAALGRHPLVKTSQVLQEEPDTLTVSASPAAPVKVSFFGGIGFGRVGEPEAANGTVAVASLLDLAATKIKVLLQRVEAKDYLDIAALLRSGLSLGDILSAAKTLFGDAFNPLSARKTLAWFEEGDFSKLDAATRELLTAEALKESRAAPLPKVSASLV
jgi:hypothetical protein